MSLVSLAAIEIPCTSQSLIHLIETVNQLEDRGIGFRSLQEAIDTNTSGGRLVFQIFGALAEFERNLIRERTQAGLAAARAKGRKGGRPKALSQTKIEVVYKLYDEKKLLKPKGRRKFPQKKGDAHYQLLPKR